MKTFIDILKAMAFFAFAVYTVVAMWMILATTAQACGAGR